ncbi:unnamed protein product [Penicillium salamii]|uniref:Uncharacterized protein n=1 Tax=Penicillium salamii TaxID=1612424 RepID=A0A9W4J3Q8_9EURO|nr:unnamed protein product [Penicillium salamii]CAG8036052.1 unnamed protein product [Penicillium salamii]CAG8055524.1 unnamed protein product [Penicillium salamii]CAG8114055.1 unnamed protein product [Penicillium salamii]CAG8261847.1 unnamed protein product [Penicillium salamii]
MRTMTMASDHVAKPTDPDGLILEAWGQGFLLGSLLILAAITVANMRAGVLLHKLILLELVLAMGHGTFIFPHEPVYGWYLSVTAIGLNISWALHNVIAWMKNRPFLSRKVSRFYIVTVVLCFPYWCLEIYANFAYFNNLNRIFLHTRHLEPLFRDPWWVFTTLSLFWTIKREYSFGLWEIIKISPRFGIMLAAMILSIAFIIVDTCSVLNAFQSVLPTGIEPFWKLSSVFKCLCDTVVLDDFKTALDHMRRHWMERKNRDIFVSPSITPNPSPRAYRARGDIESAGSPGWPDLPSVYSPTKQSGRLRYRDNTESLESRNGDEITRSPTCLVNSERPRGIPSPESSFENRHPMREDIPDIPLQRM